MKHHLTDAYIQRLKYSGKTELISDIALPGFGIRVGQHKKSWAIVFRDPRSGRQIRQTIGHYPQMTLKQARKRAVSALEESRNTIVPLRSRSSRMELRLACMSYLEARKVEVTPEHFQNMKYNVDHLVKHLGKLKVQDVHRKDLEDWLSRFKTDSQKNRGYVIAKTFFRWCLYEQYIEFSPMEGMKRPAKTKSRGRYLEQDEIKAVWSACDELSFPFGTFVQFNLAMAGAGRKSDFANLTTRSIRTFGYRDLEGELHNVECIDFSNPTKSDHAHIVPLNDFAKSVLPHTAGMFFSNTGRTPISGWNKYKKRLDKLCQVEPWTLHDIRRTASTHFGDYLDMPRHTIEQIQNRRSMHESSVVTTYNRARYLRQKKEAMDVWGGYLEKIVAPCLVLRRA